MLDETMAPVIMVQWAGGGTTHPAFHFWERAQQKLYITGRSRPWDRRYRNGWTTSCVRFMGGAL